MSDPALIEQELRQFLEIEDNLAKTDRLHYLMAIVNKHFAIDKIDHTINGYDLGEIIGHAKNLAGSTQAPLQISKLEVKGVELSYVLIMEAFTNYLNRNKLLKRLPKFDYKNRR
jgi:hypothetical protein